MSWNSTERNIVVLRHNSIVFDEIEKWPFFHVSSIPVIAFMQEVIYLYRFLEKTRNRLQIFPVFLHSIEREKTLGQSNLSRCAPLLSKLTSLKLYEKWFWLLGRLLDVVAWFQASHTWWTKNGKNSAISYYRYLYKYD